MTLEEFNSLGKEMAAPKLFNCCGSDQWVKRVMMDYPFMSLSDLINKATTAWYEDGKQEDWLAAFTHHPKIGDVKSIALKFADTQKEATAEQAGIKDADEEILEKFRAANKAYEESNGFIFIVCATGKTAHEMYRLLQDRLKNCKEEEILIATGEQHKITLLRLQKLLVEEDWISLKKSQLTTHVLDTSIGKPAQQLTVRLQQYFNNQWQTFAQGTTDKDGRIADLLPPNRLLPPAAYKLVFNTAPYFESHGSKGFYPSVEVQFEISSDTHYHVPLLLNPFGYSTYRGS
ncbi:MAG: 2-oxo-4-hydroxy-4-carboxy-5-ureidoimidazoline decarboxylase [Chitinophagaceae bacterium]